MEHTVGVPIIGRLMMNMFGFLSTPGVPQCAPLWARTSVKMMGKERVQAWIDDIMNLSWGSFVSSHGSPVLKCDHKAVRQAVYKQIGC